jgi:isopentenyl diphosphate isomerase/L-lactate dehydrogenase-like FMN-dependent dehydrogenase
VDRADPDTAVLGRPTAYRWCSRRPLTRIVHPDGEPSVARAAGRAGVPYTLSTLSTRTIEEVRAVSDGRLWFQLYASR